MKKFINVLRIVSTILLFFYSLYFSDEHPFSVKTLRTSITSWRFYRAILLAVLAVYIMYGVISGKNRGFIKIQKSLLHWASFMFYGFILLTIPMFELIESTEKEWDFYVLSLMGIICIFVGIFKIIGYDFKEKWLKFSYAAKIEKSSSYPTFFILVGFILLIAPICNQSTEYTEKRGDLSVCSLIGIFYIFTGILDLIEQHIYKK